MPGISRVNADSAGSTIVGNLAPTVHVNNNPIAVQGASIVGHGRGPHSSPVMVGSLGSVRAHNIPVCRSGDSASCGHVASGSGNVNAG
jgi:uncharacterized Zn-binding protein involved in type VI secretion